MQWDLFISHASEDKEVLVKPLVKKLEEYGLKVWYDEFELKAGDSLSASIDKGILNSRNGLIILSESFLKKNWTEYELRSLLIKEIELNNKILSIWHNVSKQDIMKKSLFLADKFSLSSNLGIDTLAHKIIETIRPDIISSNILKTAIKKFDKTESTEIKNVSLENLFDGPIVHKTIPHYIKTSSLIITQVLSEVCNMDFREFLAGFYMDWDYDSEYNIWVAITCSYVQFLNQNKISFSDIEHKKKVYNDLVQISLGNLENHLLDDKTFNILLQIYAYTYEYIKELLSA